MKKLVRESLNESQSYTIKDLYKFLKTSDEFDFKDRVYMKDGNLVVIDTWYYGEDRALKNMKTNWSPGGMYYQYFLDKFGLNLKILKVFSEVKATGIHKKLTTDGIVGVILTA